MPRRLAAGLLLAAGAADALHVSEPAPPGQPKYHWAGKNGDWLRTGASPFVAPRALAAGPSWSYHDTKEAPIVHQVAPETKTKYPAFYGLLRAAPVIDDKLNIYLSTVTMGTISKFSPDGKLLWTDHVRPYEQLPGIPSIMDGRLFSATTTGYVFALDMETGAALWNTTIATSIAGDTWAMAAGEGMVIAPAINNDKKQDGHDPNNNNRIVALDASTGAIAWTFDPEGGDIYNILVAIEAGSCVFSTAKGKVYRLDLRTGRIMWQTPTPEWGWFTTGGTILGPDGSTVYTTWNKVHFDGTNYSLQGMVSAYDFSSGQRKWDRNVEYEANNAPAIGRLSSRPDGGLSIVIGVGKNPDMPDSSKGVLSGQGPEKKARVVALDAATGSVQWAHELPPWHGAALGDDARPDICLPDAFSNPAIGGDGTVYVGFASGLLYSIRDDDGDGAISETEVSTFQTGAAFQGSPGIAPGMLVATPCDGMHVWRFRQ